MNGHDDPATLFTPMAIGALSLANRIVVAPMTRTSATPDGLATLRMADYYAEFARGGSLSSSPRARTSTRWRARANRGQPGIANAAQTEAWKPTVDAVHAAGAAIVLQLMHAGPLSSTRPPGPSRGPVAVQPAGSQLTIQGARARSASRAS